MKKGTSRESEERQKKERFRGKVRREGRENSLESRKKSRSKEESL